MLKILSTLFDRCLFTLTFIVGVQFPEFIQQYSQRLSGHLNEALLQLNEYQLIANRHFDGNLKTMIEKYLLNSEPSIKETGEIIMNTSTRASDLQAHLFNIQETDYIKRVYYFITEFDESMVQATFQQYQLAIPLSLPALSTGVASALFIVITSHIVINYTIIFIRSITNKYSKVINDK
ncbi:DUF2937 family protein [Colwellia sp. RE-S-Sl-9]